MPVARLAQVGSVRLVITDAVSDRIEPMMPVDPIRGRRWADQRDLDQTIGESTAPARRQGTSQGARLHMQSAVGAYLQPRGAVRPASSTSTAVRPLSCAASCPSCVLLPRTSTVPQLCPTGASPLAASPRLSCGRPLRPVPDTQRPPPSSTSSPSAEPHSPLLPWPPRPSDGRSRSSAADELWRRQCRWDLETTMSGAFAAFGCARRWTVLLVRASIRNRAAIGAPRRIHRPPHPRRRAVP